MSEREIIADETAHVPQGGETGVAAAAHEPDRPSIGLIGIGATVLAFLLVLGAVVPTLLEDAFEKRAKALGPPANPLASSAGRALPTGPRLQVNPWRDITEFRAAEEHTLSTYGWVDRERGVVRIPIERAIEVLAERGAKARTEVGEVIPGAAGARAAADAGAGTSDAPPPAGGGPR